MDTYLKKSSTTMIIVLSKYCINVQNVHYNDICPVKHDAQKAIYRTVSKVENILKGSLDSIISPLPSVKIQIMGGKVCLRCKGKILLGVVNKLLKTKYFPL